MKKLDQQYKERIRNAGKAPLNGNESSFSVWPFADRRCNAALRAILQNMSQILCQGEFSEKRLPGCSYGKWFHLLLLLLRNGPEVEGVWGGSLQLGCSPWYPKSSLAPSCSFLHGWPDVQSEVRMRKRIVGCFCPILSFFFLVFCARIGEGLLVIFPKYCFYKNLEKTHTWLVVYSKCIHSTKMNWAPATSKHCEQYKVM